MGHCPQHPNDPTKAGTCEAKPGAKCFSAVQEVLDPSSGQLVEERTYGCLPPDETGLLQCKGHLVPHLNPTSIGCCSDEDMCNKRLQPMYVPTPPEEPENPAVLLGMPTNTWLILLLTFMACFAVLMIIVISLVTKWKKKEQSLQRQLQNDPELGISLFPGNIHQLIENSSGSGSGKNLQKFVLISRRPRKLFIYNHATTYRFACHGPTYDS